MRVTEAIQIYLQTSPEGPYLLVKKGQANTQEVCRKVQRQVVRKVPAQLAHDNL